MNYTDILQTEEANEEAYRFWAKKVRARIKDTRKRGLLAPLQKPHSLGAKRPSMEQWYYDVFDQPNVDIADVKQNPIADVVPDGVRMSNGDLHEFDIIALATGFDSVTGGLKAMDRRGTKGLLRDKWKHGLSTHLGMCVSIFPNFFVIYGPQAPTAHANGPSAVEPQADWIVEVMKQITKDGKERLEATQEAEKEWEELVVHFGSQSLRHNVPSGWNGGNVPGKQLEPLSFSGGLGCYCDKIDETRRMGMAGFDIS